MHVTFAHPAAAASAAARTLPPLRGPAAAPAGRLTTDQLRELEAELRRDLAAVERRLAHARAADAADAVAGVSPGGTATSTAADARESAAGARQASIAAALARLAGHEYGRCLVCAAALPYGRLLVMPDATRCLTCGPRG